MNGRTGPSFGSLAPVVAALPKPGIGTSLSPAGCRAQDSRNGPGLARVPFVAGRPDRLDPAIIERATGRWAGEVVLNDLDADNLSCGFRILLAGPGYYGRGLSAPSKRQALLWAGAWVDADLLSILAGVVGASRSPAAAPMSAMAAGTAITPLGHVQRT
jgi:hypothetical protein